MRLLTIQEVVDMHDEILRRTGGQPGILSLSILDAALDRQTHGPFHGQGDLLERSAYLLRGIIQDHPFADGNKRTAMEAVFTLLQQNGILLAAPGKEVVRFALAAAQGLDIKDIEAWLRQHAQDLRPGSDKGVSC